MAKRSFWRWILSILIITIFGTLIVNAMQEDPISWGDVFLGLGMLYLYYRDEVRT